jgi:hypothetical protein
MTPKQLSSVPCPQCGAATGKRCLQPSGALRAGPQAEGQMQTPLHVCPLGQTRASSSNNAISFHFHGLDSGKPAIYDGVSRVQP